MRWRPGSREYLARMPTSNRISHHILVATLACGAVTLFTPARASAAGGVEVPA